MRKIQLYTPQRALLLAVIVAALGALVIMFLVFPKSTATESGVGADGFSVTELPDSDIGVASIASKDIVQSALGDSVASLSSVSKSSVINYNGNLDQTATHAFTTSSGVEGSVDIDLMKYKSQDAMAEANIDSGTGSAGTVNGVEVRYLPANSLGNVRNYVLLVEKNLSSYRFSISQPNSNVEIPEYKAWDILKEIIAKSKLQ